jgi:NCAIR mutase (PurE)-related protein
MNKPDRFYTGTDAAHLFLLGDVIKAATKQLKSAAMPWQLMSEASQKTLLTEVESDVRAAVTRAVTTIASDYRVSFQVQVAQATFKADGVKIALEMPVSEEAHALASVAGRSVLMVIEDGQRYLDPGDATKVESSQRSLEL